MSKGTERYFHNLDLRHARTIVITGGNSGIGFETARYLARLGWRIIMGIRNPRKGEEAKKKILEESPEAKVELRRLDLNDKASIIAFCGSLMSERIDIDVFYCNAGIYHAPYAESFDGLESQMAVNFVSNYLIYHQMRHYFQSLIHPVKFVLTSSITARFEKLNEDDLLGGKKYRKGKQYGKSKVGVNMLFQYLVAKTEMTNIIPMLVHPGVTYTPLMEKAYKSKPFLFAVNRFLRLFTHKVEKAALSSLYPLQIEMKKPMFVGPRGIGHIQGYPKEYRLYSKNLRNGKQILAKVHEILGLKPE